MRILKNKKGNWADVLEFGGLALGVGILIMIVYILLFNFNSTLLNVAGNNTVVNDTTALARSQQSVNVFPSAADFILPVLFIFFLGFSVWSARKIPSSHMFLFIGVILMVIVFLFAMVIESGWQEFTTQDAISGHVNVFPITNFILSYLRFFVLIYSLIVGWALYAKTD